MAALAESRGGAATALPDGTLAEVADLLARGGTGGGGLDRLVLAAVETSPVSFTISDMTRAEQPLVYVNRGFEATTGFSREDAIGLNCRFLQGPETRPETVAAIRASIDDVKALDIDVLNYRRTGEPFWNRLHLAPLMDRTGRLAAYVGIQHDVTEELAREEEARRRQKIAALGRIAGQVAHEINNILQPVLSLPDLIEPALPDGEDAARADLALIRTAARDARSIVRRVLDFGRPGEEGEASVAVAPAVDETLRTLARTLPPGLRLRTKVPAMAGEVALTAAELRQILGNLAANAADAMAGEGTLTVSLSQAFRPDRQAEVLLEVADTGPGLPRDSLPQLFEPFFSTKPVGAGTGLGLFIVDELARRAGGSVEAGNAPGGGARFTLRLPLVDGGTPRPGATGRT